MAITTEKMLGHLTDPYTSAPGTNLYKLFDAIQAGYWQGVNDTMDDMREQMFVATMTGKNLDEWARAINLLRRTGEGDAEYRIRIYGAIRRLIGGTNGDSIGEFVEAILGAPPGSVQVLNNCEQDGSFCPAKFAVQFDFSLLSTLGFTEDQFGDIIATIDAVLTRNSAAGVKGEVLVQGGAQWDTAVWDAAGDIFGS